MLDVGIDARRLGMLAGVLDQNMEVTRIAEVVLLPINEELFAQPTCQPVHVAIPAKLPRLQDKLESRIFREWQTCVVRASDPSTDIRTRKCGKSWLRIEFSVSATTADPWKTGTPISIAG